ncbi:hypothetical protein HGH93_31325 [Chitinophaga polysaccharea]|nr:hypothetical protein [Chitinophaga polysaccharea]
MWTDQEVDDFRKALLRTINWVETLTREREITTGTYKTILRRTNPLIADVPLYNFDAEYLAWNHNPADERRFYGDLLQQMMQQRPEVRDQYLPDIGSMGRILSFETSISAGDGAPLEASQGFVDLNDTPPVDTWFYLKSNYDHGTSYACEQVLFCWIPKAFENVMQSAINVEILDSYRWVDENDRLLYQQLQKHLPQS